MMQGMNTIHGAEAEANITEYLRYFSGRKVRPQDGIALPDMFDLGKTKFALYEFIGKESKAQSKFSFKRLGLQHGDFEQNPANGINGICIDMGGITPAAGRNLSQSKTGIRALKSLYSSTKSKTDITPEQLEDVLSSCGLSDEVKSEIKTIFKIKS